MRPTPQFPDNHPPKIRPGPEVVDRGDQFYICRKEDGKTMYLHPDGIWRPSMQAGVNGKFGYFSDEDAAKTVLEEDRAKEKEDA